MAWFSRNGRTLGVLAVGVVTGGGAVLFSDKIKSREELSPIKTVNENKSPFANSGLPVNKVLASYTTNFEPIQKWDYNWDRRDPKSLVKPPKDGAKTEDYENELKKKTPTATRHLFLIRHGQYNLKGVGDTERYLTTLGREQADMTGKRLKELSHPYTVLVNSTMTRATETADILAQHLPELPRESCDLLREGAPYPPEPPIGSWRPEESFYRDGARIEAAFRKHFHRAEVSQENNSYEIISCHANVIRYFVCRALQIPPEAWLRMGLYHGSITHIYLAPSGRVAIRTLGDAGHMPAAKVTSQ